MIEVYEMPDGLVTSNAVSCAEAWHEKAVQLQAANQELLGALERLIKQPFGMSADDKVLFDAMDAITNAKQVMGE